MAQIRDEFLEDIAKALNPDEVYTPLQKAGFSPDSVEPTDPTLSNEYGDRAEVRFDRQNNTINIRAFRRGADVTDLTNGDVLLSVGYFLDDNSSSNVRLVREFEQFVHDEDFDIEVTMSLTFDEAQ